MEPTEINKKQIKSNLKVKEEHTKLTKNEKIQKIESMALTVIAELQHHIKWYTKISKTPTELTVKIPHHNFKPNGVCKILTDILKQKCQKYKFPEQINFSVNLTENNFVVEIKNLLNKNQKAAIREIYIRSFRVYQERISLIIANNILDSANNIIMNKVKKIKKKWTLNLNEKNNACKIFEEYVPRINKFFLEFYKIYRGDVTDLFLLDEHVSRLQEYKEKIASESSISKTEEDRVEDTSSEDSLHTDEEEDQIIQTVKSLTVDLDIDPAQVYQTKFRAHFPDTFDYQCVEDRMMSLLESVKKEMEKLKNDYPKIKYKFEILKKNDSVLPSSIALLTVKKK